MGVAGYYKLNKTDLDKGTELLANAFSDYPMFTYIMGEDPNLLKMKTFLKFLLKYSIYYGEAYAPTKELEGIILFSDFRKYRFGPIRSLRSGAMSLSRIGKEEGRKFNIFNSLTSKIHKRIISKPHYYIIMIGVDPVNQGLGFGRKLMSLALSVAEEKGLPCYLETHVQDNVRFYKNLGFQVVSEDYMPDTDILQYAMLKESKWNINQ